MFLVNLYLFKTYIAFIALVKLALVAHCRPAQYKLTVANQEKTKFHSNFINIKAEYLNWKFKKPDPFYLWHVSKYKSTATLTWMPYFLYCNETLASNSHTKMSTKNLWWSEKKIQNDKDDDRQGDCNRILGGFLLLFHTAFKN